MSILGFTAEEADRFSAVLQEQMASKEMRRAAKKVKKEKKPAKMKRAELLKRLLAFMVGVHSEYAGQTEYQILVRELKGIVK
jgi:hypothetical protein